VLSAEGSTPGEKGLRGLPVVFMNEATEAIAAHDRTVGSGLPDWRSAFRDSKIESAMGPLLVVVADIGLQHRFEMAAAGELPHRINGRVAVQAEGVDIVMTPFTAVSSILGRHGPMERPAGAEPRNDNCYLKPLSPWCTWYGFPSWRGRGHR